jgi:hypothetical protein
MVLTWTTTVLLEQKELVLQIDTRSKQFLNKREMLE